MMYDNWSYGNNSGTDVFGFVFMLLVMAGIVVGIIAIVHHFNRMPKHQTQHDTALDILSKRYANGDIEKKEFEEKRKDLS
jgi:putative membrane protein